MDATATPRGISLAVGELGARGRPINKQCTAVRISSTVNEDMCGTCQADLLSLSALARDARNRRLLFPSTGSPRARAAASCLVATPPREVGPDLPGRRVAPASAASLSFSARPPSLPAPPQARGGVALPVEGRGGPVATATGLPPVSSYVPTPLARAASAHLSPPLTTAARFVFFSRRRLAGAPL